MNVTVINRITHHIWTVFHPSARCAIAAAHALQVSFPDEKSDQLENEAVEAIENFYNVVIIQGLMD